MSFHYELKWHPELGKKYRIISGLSNKMALDVSQNPKDKNNLIIWENNGGDNQRFFFTHLGGNRYAMFSAKNNQIIEVAGDNEGNGARLTCGHQNKKASEYIEFIPANFNGLSTVFYLKTFCCKAVEVSGGQATNEAHVVQQDYTGK